MSTPVTRPKYLGGTPGVSETVSLFTTAKFPGVSQLQYAGIKWFAYDISHDQDGTVKGFKSPDGGTTWIQFFEQAHTAPAAGTTSKKEVYIEMMADIRFDWENSATAQGSFVVDMALSDERAAAGI